MSAKMEERERLSRADFLRQVRHLKSRAGTDGGATGWVTLARMVAGEISITKMAPSELGEVLVAVRVCAPEAQQQMLLGRHKSWVCRRLVLAEGLSDEVTASVRLGVLSVTAARELGSCRAATRRRWPGRLHAGGPRLRRRGSAGSPGVWTSGPSP